MTDAIPEKISAQVKQIEVNDIVYRDASLRSVDGEGRKTLRASFSSEIPVYRYAYVEGKYREFFEILDHSNDAVEFDKKRGIPLLLNHNAKDIVGKVTDPEITNKTVEGNLKFSRSQTGQDVLHDVEDGIRDTVSIGYQVEQYEEDGRHNGLDLLRAVRWRLRECTLTPVPADDTVGVKRELHNKRTAQLKMKISTPLLDKQADAGGGTEKKKDQLDEVLEKEERSAVQEVTNQLRETNQREAKEMFAIVDKMKVRYPDILKVAKRFFEGEIDLATARTEAFKMIHNAKPVESTREQNIGMSAKDISKYSWANAVKMASDPRIDGFERELSREAVDKYKIEQRGPNSIVIPYDVLNWSQRDQLVATGSLGGNVVATNLLAGSFIDVLRNRMLVARAGATMLTGLVGNVAIPRQSGAVSTFWASSEAAATTEGSVTFDQVTLTPKQVTARVDYSWLLLQQSTPAVDGLIRSDFQATLARAIDLAALHGSGASGQPTGVAATSGIGSVTGGANGAAPTWANIVALETEVAVDNADIGTLAYLTNARVRGKLKTTLKGGTAATDGIYIWPEGPIADGFSQLNGYRIGTTNQVASNLTKGTSTTICSAIFFGNWSDLLIGMWSGLEILTNPYTQASNRVIETYAYQALDIGVRHPESFSAMLDALTT